MDSLITFLFGASFGVFIMFVTYHIANAMHRNWQVKQYSLWREWYEVEKAREQLRDTFKP